MGSDQADNVQVAVRCRPLNANDRSRGCNEPCVVLDTKRGSVTVKGEKGHVTDKVFNFDYVFDWNSRQVDVYAATAKPIVDSVLEGYNGTIFAYGQTGTGKTFTMEGDSKVPDLKGIIPNSFAHVFGYISQDKPNVKFLIRAAYIEIYMENIRDLLNKDPNQTLQLKEDTKRGVYVKDIKWVGVQSIDEIQKLLSYGNKNRRTGKTNMNEHSSRSHSIFTINVECAETTPAGEERIRAGKLNLVDLAGSERQSKTGAEGVRLKEAILINQSLSTLGNVIVSLVEGQKHIPYRESKLTRLLQDSLGGNAKTVMIAAFGPAAVNAEETNTTLRYANRAKNIKNAAIVNEDPKDALLRKFQDEIEKLKSQLSGEGGGDDDDGSEEEEESSSEESDGEDDSPEALRRRERRRERKIRRQKRSKQSSMLTDKKIQELQAQLDKEKDLLRNDVDMSEKKKLETKERLKQRQKQLEKAKAKRIKVAEKLSKVQGQLLVGGVDVIQKHAEQQAKLDDAAEELERRKVKVGKLKEEASRNEEMRIDVEEQYASMSEEAEIKTKKLKKLWTMYMRAKQEIKDLEEEFEREQAETVDQIRQLTSERGLKTLITKSFIPATYIDLIEESAMWDEEMHEYTLKFISHAGNNIRKMSLLQDDENTEREREAARLAAEHPDPMMEQTQVFLDYSSFVENYGEDEERETKTKNKILAGMGRAVPQSRPRRDEHVPKAKGLVKNKPRRY